MEIFGLGTSIGLLNEISTWDLIGVSQCSIASSTCRGETYRYRNVGIPRQERKDTRYRQKKKSSLYSIRFFKYIRRYLG